MILAIGEILYDIFPQYKRLGGAPFNFAFHVKNLGTPVCINLRPHCFTKQIIAGIKGKQNEKA